MPNLVRLPGLIDIHVHFRDPGQTQKEDFYTGTLAAISAGVTSVFDMPNNIKPIFSNKLLEEKLEIAGKKAVSDWGLYFGTNGENTEEFDIVKDKVVGLKVYLNETTGNLLINNKKTEAVFNSWPKDKVIVVHAEGEQIDIVVNLCKKLGNKTHFTHVSTKGALTKIIEAKRKDLPISCDVTPHHLFLTINDMVNLEGFGKVKPPLCPKEDQDFLWENISIIDCIATDHAPHTKDEKKSENPPYGLPGLETLLGLLLTSVNRGIINIDDVIRLTNTNPQKIFNYKQHQETYIEVDLNKEYEINNSILKTKCGWTPYAGRKIKGKVKRVFIRGKKVFEEDKVLVSPGFGKRVETTD